MSAEHESQTFHGLYIEVANIDLVFRSVGVSDRTLTGGQILSFCDATPRDEHVVLQWLPSGDLEEIREDEVVDIRGAAGARFVVAKSDRLFRFALNDRSLAWPVGEIGEAALRTLGQVPAAETLYLQSEDAADLPVDAGGRVALKEAGVERIYSKPAVWKLNVQGVVIESETPTVLVRDALVRAGFDPGQGWIVVLKASDGKRQVSLDESVDLRAPGIEKLRLTPREINNGEMAATRRDFRLLPGDEAGLTARQLRWETVIDGHRRWLVLSDLELPAGYQTATATVAVEVPPSYPTAELDMFFCRPHLARQDGVTIPQTQVNETIEGQVFQRWSRHRGGAAPWRVGTDNVITHLALIEAALLREVEQ